MLLFIKSFPVMETPDCSTQAQAPRSTTPLQDEEMAKVPMASLTLEKVVYRSLNVDDSFHDKTGMIIQILNSHCPGSPLVIGGLRINLQDIMQVPRYLEQNRAIIKQHAAKVLLDHWITLNYGMGCNEGITVDDFGLTFTIGPYHQCLHLPPSSSPKEKCHPKKRKGGQGCCLCCCLCCCCHSISQAYPSNSSTYWVHRDHPQEVQAKSLSYSIRIRHQTCPLPCQATAHLHQRQRRAEGGDGTSPRPYQQGTEPDDPNTSPTDTKDPSVAPSKPRA